MLVYSQVIQTNFNSIGRHLSAAMAQNQSLNIFVELSLVPTPALAEAELA